MIHHQVPRNPKFRPAGSEKEVFAATTCPKCQPSLFFVPLSAQIDM